MAVLSLHCCLGSLPLVFVSEGYSLVEVLRAFSLQCVGFSLSPYFSGGFSCFCVSCSTWASVVVKYGLGS